MKVALAIENFDPALGGAEAWTWQFAARLSARGHDVHVAAKSFSAETESLGVTPLVLPQLRSRFALAQAAGEMLRGCSPDVTHDMGMGGRCDVFQPHGGSRTASFEQNLLLLPRLLRPGKRQAARLLPRYREFRRLLARQFADDDRIIIALSRMTAQHMKLYHQVPDDRIRLVYNGVDLERFSPEHRSAHRDPLRRQLVVRDDEMLLLIVAHNFRLKGVPTLLRSVGQLRQAGQPVRLVVAGGKHPDRYRGMARRFGAESAVTFVGSIKNITPYYAAADVYVQPTFYDPCSLVVLEALASGLPVITSAFNGAGELLTEGVEGHVVDDPRDWRTLADRLSQLQDASRREQMGLAARRLAEAHSLDRNCDEIVNIYGEIAQRKRRAA